jgi:hypothetical protein
MMWEFLLNILNLKIPALTFRTDYKLQLRHFNPLYTSTISHRNQNNLCTSLIIPILFYFLHTNKFWTLLHNSILFSFQNFYFDQQSYSLHREVSKLVNFISFLFCNCHNALIYQQDDDEDEMRDIHVGTIPYFLYLASLSDLISRALLKDVLQFIDLEIACKIFLLFVILK